MYKAVTDASDNDKITETKLGQVPVYQFEITAKIDDVSYPKQVYYVQKNNLLPLKIQSYSLSGTLMQTAYFVKYTGFKGSICGPRESLWMNFKKAIKNWWKLKTSRRK